MIGMLIGCGLRRLTDLGPDYYEHRDVDRARARAVHALERLGVKVTVEAGA